MMFRLKYDTNWAQLGGEIKVGSLWEPMEAWEVKGAQNLYLNFQLYLQRRREKTNAQEGLFTS